MTNEEQRIAIAEACGLDTPEFNCDFGNECYDDCVEGFNERLKELPDYLNDLNACHEFEKSLTNEQRRFYAEVLINVHPLHYSPIGNDVEDAEMKLFMIATMTPAQKCEAFLRTKGLWKEEEKV